MEEGSLLQEALNHRGPGSCAELQNTLIVDVFLIDDSSSPSKEEHILALAELCVDLNRFVQSQDYPWWSGGDGAVFGIASTEDQQIYLQGVCRYAVSVADEWKLISLVQEYSKGNEKIVSKVWDMDDGDILIIQGAYSLPAWVHSSRDEAAMCRNRCWIQSGKFYWIEPSADAVTAGFDTAESLSVSDALRILQAKSPDRVKLASKDFHAAVSERTRSADITHPPLHLAALTVPRGVAHLLEKRPDLASAACAAFAELVSEPVQSTRPAATTNEELWDDWVWTTHAFGRTQYALLRTAVSSSADWRTSDSFPARFGSVELRRQQRQAAVEATPHLRFGVSLGVRIVAGLDALLAQKSSSNRQCSLIEHRIFHCWPRLLGEDVAWLLQAFKLGPQNAKHNLDHVLKSPVFPEELSSRTPFSFPDTDLNFQIRSTLREGRKLESAWLGIPNAQDIDNNEEWMEFPPNLMDSTAKQNDTEEADMPGNSADPNTNLDSMLKGVKSFFQGTSEVEGVSHDDERNRAQYEPIAIDPAVFLHLFYATLKAKTAQEMNFLDAPMENTDMDPYFSKDDFDLMSADDSSSEGEVETDLGGPAIGDIMQAMDQELLREPALSRTYDSPEIGGFGAGDDNDDAVREDSHVLSNLLHSLEVGAGGAGPVRNLLQEVNTDNANAIERLPTQENSG